MSALTEKDRKGLEYGLTLEVDWIALSFVQRPDDIHELSGNVDLCGAGYGSAQSVANR